jgi:carbonic anhydrase
MTISPSDALKRLQRGNARFVMGPDCGESTAPPSREFEDLSSGQNPVAAVLACSDSRVPVETIFCQGAGDLFVVRVAGNVVGPTQLGTLEFAVEKLGVPLILLMGHTGCGAVAAAMDAFHHRLSSSASRNPDAASGPISRNLDAIVAPISRILEEWKETHPQADPLGAREVERLNVVAACRDLTRNSEMLAARAETGGIVVTGSIYDLQTGRVEFDVT